MDGSSGRESHIGQHIGLDVIHECCQLGHAVARLISDFAPLLSGCSRVVLGECSSTALVRYRCNGYSVPTAFGFQDVIVKGLVDEVVILCGSAVLARHMRAYGEGEFIADPLHYLALIETKPDAPRGKLYIDPLLPAWLPDLTVLDLRLGSHRFDIRFWREGEETKFEMLRGDPKAIERITADRCFDRMRAWAEPA